MSLFTSFRAGSGAYQNVTPILVQNSIVVNPSAVSLVTLSAGQLADGSLTNFASDGIIYPQFANPGLLSTSASLGSISGVIINDAWVSSNTSGATGANNNLYLWLQNMTAVTATIPSSTQINLLQF